MKTSWFTLARVAALGAGIAAYTAAHASHDYQLRKFRLCVDSPALAMLGTGEPGLRILHLSDTHLYRGREDLVAWLTRLAQRAHEDYDLVLLTGDLLSTVFGEKFLIERALTPLIESGVPGAYVFGYHDFEVNQIGNPLSYLCRTTQAESVSQRGFSERENNLTRLLKDSDWLDLNNTQASLQVRGVNLEFSGVADPHAGWDDFVGFSPRAEVVAGAALRLGLAHAPYRAMLDKFAASGAEVVFCGHTHGGQVCLPTGCALTSNCDLPTRYASGLFAWKLGANGFGEPAALSRVPAGHRTAVSVSPGLGTSPFTPWRTFCPPSAYLIELVS